MISARSIEKTRALGNRGPALSDSWATSGWRRSTPLYLPDTRSPEEQLTLPQFPFSYTPLAEISTHGAREQKPRTEERFDRAGAVKRRRLYAGSSTRLFQAASTCLDDVKATTSRRRCSARAPTRLRSVPFAQRVYVSCVHRPFHRTNRSRDETPLLPFCCSVFVAASSNASLGVSENVCKKP